MLAAPAEQMLGNQLTRGLYRQYLVKILMIQFGVDVAPNRVQVSEVGHEPCLIQLAARQHHLDDEGVAVQPRALVTGGQVLRRWDAAKENSLPMV